jgi:hypothetical protein
VSTTPTPIQRATEIANAERAATVAQLLGNHRGAGNGIHVRQLALKALITERAVRQAVTDLRMQGVSVCGTPDTGYFLATSAAELGPTLQFIRSRALKSLLLEARLRKVALPDLIGQLRVPT